MKYDVVNKIVKIKKEVRTLIWTQLYFTSIYGFLRDIIGLPNSITYFLDLLTFGMTLYAIVTFSFFKRNTKQFYMLVGIIGILFLTTLVGFILNGYSYLLYLWGFRNTFRFYLFFFLCAMYLQKDDVEKILVFFKYLLYLSVLTATLEFLMGFRGDYIGGIFGTLQGGNGNLNIVLIIVTTITIIKYLAKKTNIMDLVCVIFSCIYLMSIAELKVYLFELPIILIVAVLNEKFTLRKIGVILLITLGVVSGVTLLGYFFPTSGIDFFTTNAIKQYMGNNGYTGSGDLSRLNAVMKSQRLFFGENTKLLLFGFGLGNCSYSGFDILTSNFYNLFKDIHYQWFADSMIFLETGWVGLILFESFFLILFLVSTIYSRKIDIKSNAYVTTKSITILSLCCILLTVYDNSLTMEVAYLMYGFLASVLVIVKRGNR